jgi:hypothetical protein
MRGRKYGEILWRLGLLELDVPSDDSR